MDLFDKLNAQIDRLQSSLIFVTDERKRAEIRAQITRLQHQIIRLESRSR
jgi:hypothetical protein